MALSRSLMLGTAAALMITATGAQAADLLRSDPVYSQQSLFDFEGLYVGVTGGAALTSSLYGTTGIVVGSNFAITDGILVGAEFQGDLYFNGGGIAAYDALALGRVGGFVSDNTMIYGNLGVGYLNTTAVYAFGGGVEMAMTDSLSVRGEGQAIGGFGLAPSIGKANVGLIWHMH